MNATLEIGFSLALRASSINVSILRGGMSVSTISLPADAIWLKLVSTVTGSSCFSIAVITHFCRAIRS